MRLRAVSFLCAAAAAALVSFAGVVSAAEGDARTKADSLKAKGDFLVVAGKPAEAATAYRGALRHDPGMTEVRGALADALVAAGRGDEAVRELEEARKVDPGYDEALLKIATIETSRGRYPEAALFYRFYLAKKKNHPDALLGLADALAGMGDRAAAVSAYGKYLKYEKRKGKKASKEYARKRMDEVAKMASPTVVDFEADATAGAAGTSDPSRSGLKDPFDTAPGEALPLAVDAGTDRSGLKDPFGAPAAGATPAAKAKPAGPRLPLATEEGRMGLADPFAPKPPVKTSRPEPAAAPPVKAKPAKVEPISRAKTLDPLARAKAMADAEASTSEDDFTFDVADVEPAADKSDDEPEAKPDDAKPARTKPAAPAAETGAEPTDDVEPTAGPGSHVPSGPTVDISEDLAAGDVAFGREDYRTARMLYQAAAESARTHPGAWFKLGAAELLMEDVDAAVESWKRALALDPGNDALRVRLERLYGLRARRVEHGTIASESAPAPPGPERRLIAAEDLLRDGRPAVALTEVNTVLRARPDSADALLHRGHVLLALGRHAEAAESYKRAAGAEPGWAAPWKSLGDTYRRLGDSRLARYYYQRFLDSAEESTRSADAASLTEVRALLGR